jgi:hypothetical protein
MSLFAMYPELKDIKPYLLTRKEYAALVKQAALKIIKDYIQQRNQARLDLKAWSEANPGPKRPSWFPSEAARQRWIDLDESHASKWYREYDKVYSLSGTVEQLKRNIILANIIEDGRYETCRDDKNFWMYFGGVNNPLMNQGQSVFTAMLQHIDVPTHVLAEWPEGVEQVRKDMAAQERWNQLNPEYA